MTNHTMVRSENSESKTWEGGTTVKQQKKNK